MSDDNRAPTPMQVVGRAIISGDFQQKFSPLLKPHGIEVDRFTRVVLTAIQQNPGVLEGDRESLYTSCLNAAGRGLLPDGREGALVIFNTKVGDSWVKKVQFMPMVEGIIKEMGRAGVHAYAVSVYEKDQIRIWNDDDGQHVEHTPLVFGNRGERIGVYAAGKTSQGRSYVEAMNLDDIAKVRARSKQKDKDGNPTGTWKTDPERMEQKSALHRLRKRIPILRDVGDDPDNDGDMELTPFVAPAAQEAPPAALALPAPSNDTKAAPPAVRRPKALQAALAAAKPSQPAPAAQAAPPHDDRPPPPSGPEDYGMQGGDGEVF